MSKAEITSKDLIKLVDEERVQEVTNVGLFKKLLNTEPPKQWLKHQQFTKTDYLPIDKVENLLDTIFQEWRIEVLDLKQIAQSVVCTVRVHYRNQITGEWSYHDGVGAVGIQTDKGYSASDLGHIKQDAIQKAAPAAKSYAIKDAAEHLGKLFGRDLNRKDTVDFVNVYTDSEEKKVSIFEKRIDLAKKYKEFMGCTDREASTWVVRLSDNAVESWLSSWAVGERPLRPLRVAQEVKNE